MATLFYYFFFSEVGDTHFSEDRFEFIKRFFSSNKNQPPKNYNDDKSNDKNQASNRGGFDKFINLFSNKGNDIMEEKNI